jgi:hypothetical protein
MTPMMRMPVLRQIYKTPEGPWWRRLLDWWMKPVVYEVAEPFFFESTSLDGTTFRLYMPAGFRSDLASTPRLTWLLGYRPDGFLLIPGLFHDFWYRHGYVVAVRENEKGQDEVVLLGASKARADRLLMHLAHEIGGLHLPGHMAYWALTLFGWPAWWGNAKHREAARTTRNFQLHGDYSYGDDE